MKVTRNQVIPASGVIIDRKRGKLHIINPGRIQNIAQGYFDGTGFHPIRSSPDYDPDRAGDDYSDVRRKKRKKKAVAKKRKATAKRKKVVSKKRR